MKLLICGGGAGFIGSNFIRRMLAPATGLGATGRRRRRSEQVAIVNLDKLTYAGNRTTCAPWRPLPPATRLSTRRHLRRDAVRRGARPRGHAIVNFAAETHVDRSIVDPEAFLRNDTQDVLEAVRELGIKRMVQVSTDEVLRVGGRGSCAEDYPLAPSSPYSASKAGALSGARHHHHGAPVMHDPEPAYVRGSTSIRQAHPPFCDQRSELPLYCAWLNVRDWLHVDDHCAGIRVEHGEPGQMSFYNVGGGNERTNLDIHEHNPR